MKGLPPARFGAVLARRSVTADSLATHGPDGLMLVCGNTGKASASSLMRQSIAGAEPRPMVWPMDESRYGAVEFEGIVSETLNRTLEKRAGRTTLAWRKIAIVSNLGVGFLLSEADAIRRAAA